MPYFSISLKIPQCFWTVFVLDKIFIIEHFNLPIRHTKNMQQNIKTSMFPEAIIIMLCISSMKIKCLLMTLLTHTPFLLWLTKDVRGVDLQDKPAVSLVRVGAEDGEDGALLPGLGQQLVHIHLPLGKLKVCPGLALVGAVPKNNET